MASTRRPSPVEQAASNAWLGADGGCIFADAPNAVTSAAVIVRQVSTHRNITPLRGTRQSRASSRASGGFTTIVLKNSSPARSFTLLTRIRWINLCRDRPERCLQTGRRCFTNKGAALWCGRKSRGQISASQGPRVESDRLQLVLSQLLPGRLAVLLLRGPHMCDVCYWPLASFRGRAAIGSLLERSGHQLAGKIRRLGRE